VHIKNIGQFRDFISKQLTDLCDGKISPQTANSCAMLGANILLSIRTEMDYAKVTQEIKRIDFMETGGDSVEPPKSVQTLIKKLK